MNKWFCDVISLMYRYVTEWFQWFSDWCLHRSGGSSWNGCSGSETRMHIWREETVWFGHERAAVVRPTSLHKTAGTRETLMTQKQRMMLSSQLMMWHMSAWSWTQAHILYIQQTSLQWRSTQFTQTCTGSPRSLAPLIHTSDQSYLNPGEVGGCTLGSGRVKTQTLSPHLRQHTTHASADLCSWYGSVNCRAGEKIL